MRTQSAQWFTKSGLGRDPIAAHGAPVSFTAHADNLLPGSNVVMDMASLQSGYRTPYLIDEIRMQVYTASGGAAINPSYATAFQFRVGQYAFSAAPVGMILHQPQYNVQLISQLSGNQRAGNDARWILAQPLLMMPGDGIQCSVFRDPVIAASGNFAFSVDVTYVGRALPPGASVPSTRKVPWIASFAHDFANAYSHTGTDFRNPFLDRVLNVHRFVGRPVCKDAFGGGNTSAAVSVSQMAQGYMLPTPFGTKYATIYMDDSQGYKITNKFVPVGTVFDSERCTWTFSRPLGPREQYNMQFQTQGSQGAGSMMFAVAMHGWREEG